jgi:AcrR family transcriptional regulator
MATRRRKKTRPPGRPSAEDGPAVRRETLLAIAARQIGQLGFAQASFRGIAAEAGVSYGTVQHHFPTKQALWSALVSEVLVPSYVHARRVSLPEGIGDELTDRIRARIEGAVERPGLSAAVLMDGSAGAEARLRELVEALTPIRAVELEVLRALQASGQLRAVDPLALQAVMGIALSALTSAKPALRILVGLDLDEPAARERLARGIADLLLHGLLPR